MSATIHTGHLLHLVVLARAGVVADAATELGISRRNLRQMVHSFEQQVGVPLFIWSRNTVTVTEAGAVFIAQAQAVMDVLHRAVRRINGNGDVLEHLVPPPRYAPRSDGQHGAIEHGGSAIGGAALDGSV